MSDAYQGPERRHSEIDPETAAKIAVIDERTAWIVKAIEKLATVESVKAVEGRVDRHISSHVTKGGLVVAWVGTAIAFCVGLFGILDK